MKTLIKIYHAIMRVTFKKLQSLLGLITIGPRAIILNSDNQILLVKHSYQSHWYLPGGGVKKGESIKAAIVRELQEEVGVIVQQNDLRLFDVYFHTYLGVNDYPIIYLVKDYQNTNVKSPEIEKMSWFDYTNLPEMISPGTKRRLNEFFNNTARTERW